MKSKYYKSLNLLPFLFLTMNCQGLTDSSDLEGQACNYKKETIRVCETKFCTGSQLCGKDDTWQKCECVKESPEETGGSDSSGGTVSQRPSGAGGDESVGGSENTKNAGGTVNETGGSDSGGTVSGTGGKPDENPSGGMGGVVNTGGSSTGGASPSECERLNKLDDDKYCRELTIKRYGNQQLPNVGDVGYSCGQITDECGNLRHCGGCNEYLECGGDTFKIDNLYQNSKDIVQEGQENVCGGGCKRFRGNLKCPDVNNGAIYACLFSDGPKTEDGSELKINKMNLDGIISCPQIPSGEPQKPILYDNKELSSDFESLFENIHCCEIEHD